MMAMGPREFCQALDTTPEVDGAAAVQGFIYLTVCNPDVAPGVYRYRTGRAHRPACRQFQEMLDGLIGVRTLSAEHGQRRGREPRDDTGEVISRSPGHLGV